MSAGALGGIIDADTKYNNLQVTEIEVCKAGRKHAAQAAIMFVELSDVARVRAENTSDASSSSAQSPRWGGKEGHKVQVVNVVVSATGCLTSSNGFKTSIKLFGKISTHV